MVESREETAAGTKMEDYGKNKDNVANHNKAQFSEMCSNNIAQKKLTSHSCTQNTPHHSLHLLLSSNSHLVH
eukprot:11568643-Ditylum_brightwellii.AAC.1